MEVFSMRSFRWFLTVFFFTNLVVVPSTGLSQRKGLKKIHVGVPAVSMGNIIIFFSKEAKIYEKHGLDAEAVVMSGSGICLQGTDRRQRYHFTYYHAGSDERCAGGLGHGDISAHYARGHSIPGGPAGNKAS
jgi:hypothetical protein